MNMENKNITVGNVVLVIVSTGERNIAVEIVVQEFVNMENGRVDVGSVVPITVNMEDAKVSVEVVRRSS